MVLIVFFTGEHGACGRNLQQEENVNNLQSMNGGKVSLGKKTGDSAKFTNVNKLLDPKITLNAKSTDKADVWSK